MGSRGDGEQGRWGAGEMGSRGDGENVHSNSPGAPFAPYLPHLYPRVPEKERMAVSNCSIFKGLLT
ncbi:hypothetical protein MiSe_23350 [Microseira wollei NIES-4236]|uniref:Uncharacterized protein n=1 Tax=Microseira wollei NIES-4236 TaxID=2530354 RepID=A0AAV3X8D2_9CYAN|nr:hypothetical protein MiSe_23350 [Microseira wollei NIES-4236]